MKRNARFPGGGVDEEGFEKRADTDANAAAPGGRRIVRSGTDVAAGLFLLACAALAWWFGQNLKVGTAYRMGPGYAPLLLSWIMAIFGAVLVANGVMRSGPGLDRWPLKPILLVIGAIVIFGMSIERLGLLISSIIVVLMGGLAAPQPRVREALIWSLCLAGAATVLFAVALQLPLRIFPW